MKLNDKQIAHAAVRERPYKLFDENGLYLEISLFGKSPDHPLKGWSGDFGLRNLRHFIRGGFLSSPTLPLFYSPAQSAGLKLE